ncbi:hypothetical protein GJAV_G00076940 [Gymnothorax javanicus]|nr:hypothetical protein GJAV_G00076940 [Gymnothorax javanicus]
MDEENAHFSEYVSTLTLRDRECYFKKLTLTDGTTFTNPYTLTHWMDDLTGLPTVQWPDIYTYLIEKPSVYTQDKLKAYKSLDAYNYVLNGHVQDLQYYYLSDDFCFMRAQVLPSQRQGQKTRMYQAWAIVNRRSSYILTANCTCMAGLGSCCSHAAAVLFKVELFVRMGRAEASSHFRRMPLETNKERG